MLMGLSLADTADESFGWAVLQLTEEVKRLVWVEGAGE